MTPLEPLMPLLGAASIVIAICRYHMAPEVGPEHPYKSILIKRSCGTITAPGISTISG
jgi:hypothetical protein